MFNTSVEIESNSLSFLGAINKLFLVGILCTAHLYWLTTGAEELL